ncbi:MAG: DNA primase [Acidaminococcales bacterium]|jgi:DNA primase|nr:DNA primase [Acidaminococcales bacterium]
MDDSYKDFIQTVKNRCDIVSLVSEHVTLKKRGGKFWGCCPFHQEKTPSFSVSPDKGLFYCFGCGAGGDAIAFAQKIGDLSFSEALELIAGKFGVPVPDGRKAGRQRKKDDEAGEIYAVNALAVNYFAACLQKTAFGQETRAYLSGRGIDAGTAGRFSLGVALGGGKSLCKAFMQKEVSLELLLKARLAALREGGDCYDVFRSRLMIPIKDPRGNVVGFGGRLLGEGQPKYLNTAESGVFNKRHLLYGLDLALAQIKSSGAAIVVEGYMDAIALHAAGFTNAVASMGTAFSPEQANLIARVAKELVFCYDSDPAGRKAAMRAVSIARAAGVRTKAILLDGAKDPDEFILKFGAEKFSALLRQAPDGWAFQKAFVLSQTDFSTLAGKVEAVSNIIPVIAELGNSLETQNAISELARELTIDEAAIAGEFNKYLSRQKKYGALSPRPVPAAQLRKGKGARAEAEKQLIWAIAQRPEAMEWVEDMQTRLSNRWGGIRQEAGAEGEETAGIAAPCYHELKEIAGLLREQPDKEGADERLSGILPYLGDESRAKVAELLTDEAGLLVDEDKGADIGQLAKDCIRLLEKSFWEQKYDEHRKRAAAYESAGDVRLARELGKSQKIKNEIRKLF